MPDDAQGEIEDALREVRSAVGDTTYPLPLPSAQEAVEQAATAASLLDNYLLPRLANPQAPLLVAVSGPTGVGKSTLVNSLIRAPASAAGVLRPTTRAPVLVCHPTDATWFRGNALLPGYTRTAAPTDDPRKLHIVTATALDPGCAFLDTPDIDSVVGQDTDRSHQLLAAADLWLFVVTAVRYGDAVPWQLVDIARQRGAVVALVLDRAPEPAVDEVIDHLGEMLAARDLGDTPLFVVPESPVDGYGLLPERVVQPLRDWCDALARDLPSRTALVQRNLGGGIAALVPTVEVLAVAVEDQVSVAEILAEQAGMAYGAARAAAERGVRDGALLRGPVLARWQEFVAAGEWLRTPLATVGRLRDRLMVAVRRPSGAGQALAEAVEAGLVSLLRSVTVEAAEQTYRAWRAQARPGDLLSSDSGDAERAARLVQQWRDDLFARVRDATATATGWLGYAETATGALVLAAVAAPVSPPDAVTGEDRDVLVAVGDDELLRRLATEARDDLLDRIGVLLDTEAARFLDRLAAVSPDSGPAVRLRAAVAALELALAAYARSSGDRNDGDSSGDRNDGDSSGDQNDGDAPAVPAGPMVVRETSL
jgi:hypothetical protein